MYNNSSRQFCKTRNTIVRSHLQYFADREKSKLLEKKLLPQTGFVPPPGDPHKRWPPIPIGQDYRKTGNEIILSGWG